MTIGGYSQASLSNNLILFKGDTVLFLTKPQSVSLANYTLQAEQNKKRFIKALQREEKLHELWEETTTQLKAQKELSENLKKELATREEQIKLFQEQRKKEKRKKFIQNTGVGIVIGVVGTLLLTN